MPEPVEALARHQMVVAGFGEEDRAGCSCLLVVSGSTAADCCCHSAMEEPRHTRARSCTGDGKAGFDVGVQVCGGRMQGLMACSFNQTVAASLVLELGESACVSLRSEERLSAPCHAILA